MSFFKSVGYIINYKTFALTILSVLTTYLCIQYNIVANFPLTLVGIAIVFPIVFSINSAYRRRERALRSLAEIKGNALGIYHTVKNQVAEEFDQDRDLMKQNVMLLFTNIKDFLMSGEEEAEEKERQIYDTLSEISRSFKSFKEHGLAGRFVARMNQYLTKVMVGIDHLKIVFYYRTPRTLRAYSKVFIYSFPILYAPYFAYNALEFSPGLGYIMPILFSFILVSLDNIQEHLENPYDQIGEDDIYLDLDEIENMMK